MSTVEVYLTIVYQHGVMINLIDCISQDNLSVSVIKLKKWPHCQYGKETRWKGYESLCSCWCFVKSGG